MLTQDIYRVTQDGVFARDWGLSGQIRRAAVSVMSNIAEGFERTSRREFLHFLTIAKASCAEVRSQMYVALDAGYVKRGDFDDLVARAEEVARVISGLRSSIEKRQAAQASSP